MLSYNDLIVSNNKCIDNSSNESHFFFFNKFHPYSRKSHIIALSG